jgi:uncharacterized protein (DUF488 family)
MSKRELFTIGHSTREWSTFVSLLKVWKIEELIDVRTVPRSRTFPWFSKNRMERALPQLGILYLHMPSLGGFQISRTESTNAGWQNERFRAYADYMQTKEFAAGIAELDQRRKKRRVCVMCSEAVWWRCHRRMIADAEVAQGIPVRHIMSETAAPRHELTSFAIVSKRRGRPRLLTYPEHLRTTVAR